MEYDNIVIYGRGSKNALNQVPHYRYIYEIKWFKVRCENHRNQSKKIWMNTPAFHRNVPKRHLPSDIKTRIEKEKRRTEQVRLSHVDSSGNGASENGARGNWSVRGFLRRRRGAVITLLKSLNDELADRNLDSRLQHQ